MTLNRETRRRMRMATAKWKRKRALKRARTKAEIVWTTRDGRNLRPTEMSTSHLIASIRLASWRSRRIMLNDALDALAYASGAPDMASYYAEQGANDLLNSIDDAAVRLAYVRRESKIVEEMYRELMTRELTVESVLV